MIESRRKHRYLRAQSKYLDRKLQKATSNQNFKYHYYNKFKINKKYEENTGNYRKYKK